jgi:hypothetical protein
MLPVACVNHYLWALYLPPILIVAGSVVRAKLLERREGSEDDDPADLDEASGEVR